MERESIGIFKIEFVVLFGKYCWLGAEGG